jgi:hypothetical protein
MIVNIIALIIIIYVAYFILSTLCGKRHNKEIFSKYIEDETNLIGKYQYGPFIKPIKTSIHCFISKTQDPPNNVDLTNYEGISIIICISNLNKSGDYLHKVKIYANRIGKKYIDDAYLYIYNKYTFK